MEILKVHNIVDVLTLIVTIATFVVAILAYRHSRKVEKINTRNLIAGKKARLKAMRTASKLGVSNSELGRMSYDESLLSAEIEELKKML